MDRIVENVRKQLAMQPQGWFGHTEEMAREISQKLDCDFKMEPTSHNSKLGVRYRRKTPTPTMDQNVADVRKQLLMQQSIWFNHTEDEASEIAKVVDCTFLKVQRENDIGVVYSRKPKPAPTKYYKVLNSTWNHHGFQFQIGLNVDTNPLDTNECQNGLHFCEEKDVEYWIRNIPNATWVAEVYLHPDSKVYRPFGNKLKTDMLFLSTPVLVHAFKK